MNASKMNRKPSMGDVAEAVGVSKTTISRYLHGEYAYMSSETKAKIEQVIRELGYRPNRMAQGLKATVSHMVGVSIADVGNPFSSLLLTLPWLKPQDSCELGLLGFRRYV